MVWVPTPTYAPLVLESAVIPDETDPTLESLTVKIYPVCNPLLTMELGLLILSSLN